MVSTHIADAALIAMVHRHFTLWAEWGHLAKVDDRDTGATTTNSLRRAFLVARRKRALAQQIQLALVEAALEPEQQAVIAVPWRIDGLLIHQNGVDLSSAESAASTSMRTYG
jgi:hypothetical protein